MSDKKKLPITENHQSTLQICKQVAMEDKKLPTDHQQSLSDWVVDMDSKALDPQSWENKLNKEEMRWKQKCIYKIPKGFSHPDRMKAYQPQVVSLGPYHHGEEHLNAMEEHKERAFLHFLARTKKSVRDYTGALKEVGEQLIMDSYDKLDEEWKLHPDKFLKLMMVDGCFMLELFLFITPEDDPICERIPPAVRKYSKNDPIFSEHAWISIMPRIVRDMLMIENQIPLLVLKTLLSTATSSPQDDVNVVEEIHSLVFEFFFNAHWKPASSKEDLHVLSMFRRSMIPDSNNLGGLPPPTMDVMWPAVELEMAGIRFKSCDTRSLSDVKFDTDGGVLYLPEIFVDDATESTPLNLMAFEHLHAGVARKDVTSYVSFMGNIIDSEKDVFLLANSNILRILGAGRYKFVAQLFNGLAHDVSIDPRSSLERVHREVAEYCNRDWNKWKVYVQRTYSKSPWALFFSVLATIFVLGQTVFGIVFTVLGYYRA